MSSPVLIDGRLGSRDLIKFAPLNDPSFATITDPSNGIPHLNSGDVCFSGITSSGSSLIGIELKHISDFVASRQSGRLQGVNGQIESMLRDYDESWLLTYGTYQCGDSGDLEYLRYSGKGKLKVGKSGISSGVGSKSKSSIAWTPATIGSRIIKYAYLESMLVSLNDLGIRTKHVYDLSQAARWIYTLYVKRSKPWKDQCKSFRTFNKSGDPRPSTSRIISIDADPRIIQCAQTIGSLRHAGLNFERGLIIARHFNGSIRRAFNAGPDEWQKIKGIGKVIAKSAEEIIR